MLIHTIILCVYVHMFVDVYICLHIYIYIYIYICMFRPRASLGRNLSRNNSMAMTRLDINPLMKSMDSVDGRIISESDDNLNRITTHRYML
jgi:hypothetical protein